MQLAERRRLPMSMSIFGPSWLQTLILALQSGSLFETPVVHSVRASIPLAMTATSFGKFAIYKGHPFPR